MASNYETGHTKNAAHFESLISFITSFGAPYNPSNSQFAVAAMKVQLTAARSALATAQTQKTTWQNTTDAREVAFKPLKPLATKIVNAFAVSGVSAEVVDNAKAINRKLQGKRAGGSQKDDTKAEEIPTREDTKTEEGSTKDGDTKSPDENPGKKQISASRQSYDSLVEHFNALLELAKQTPLYKPNEAELKVNALQVTYNNLVTVNSAAINGETAIAAGLAARNLIMYKPVTGMVDTGLGAKLYIKSVFGAASQQYNEVKKLEFRDLS